jgi:predicted ATPase
MLIGITLKNFKCFKEKTHFPLSKINLLTGVNGGGKSSMLQSLLLFTQSDRENRLYLNGDYIELGMLEDVKNSENPIGMQKSSGRSRFEWQFRYYQS